MLLSRSPPPPHHRWTQQVHVELTSLPPFSDLGRAGASTASTPAWAMMVLAVAAPSRSWPHVYILGHLRSSRVAAPRADFPVRAWRASLSKNCFAAPWYIVWSRCGVGVCEGHARLISTPLIVVGVVWCAEGWMRKRHWRAQHCTSGAR